MTSEDRGQSNLIGSDRVEGTAVYAADGKKIGQIQRVMIDKRSGQVTYAVLSFGGFFGLGEDYYPVPWESLRYDIGLEGYKAGLTEERLQGAPKYRDEDKWDWADRATGRSVSLFYGFPVD
jgi:sporulation protein YlmC with PRC-barrel domain